MRTLAAHSAEMRSRSAWIWPASSRLGPVSATETEVWGVPEPWRGTIFTEISQFNLQ